MNSKNETLTCLSPLSPDAIFSSAAGNQSPTQKPLFRVLLVEDNVQLADLLRLILESSELQPTLAYFGWEASRLLEQEEFRLAIVDIDLPDTTGFELVAGALARGRLQNTKIIFFSGCHSADRAAMARQFPGSVFVPKPFQMHDLMALIGKLFPNEPILQG